MASNGSAEFTSVVGMKLGWNSPDRGGCVMSCEWINGENNVGGRGMWCGKEDVEDK